MTGAVAIAKLIELAHTFGPAIAATVEDVAERLRAAHPELRQPPPERADDEIARATAQALSERFPTSDAAPSTERSPTTEP